MVFELFDCTFDWIFSYGFSGLIEAGISCLKRAWLAAVLGFRPRSGPVVAHYLVLLARLKPASAPGLRCFDDTGQTINLFTFARQTIPSTFATTSKRRWESRPNNLSIRRSNCATCDEPSGS